jgi:hypothetical protein
MVVMEVAAVAVDLEEVVIEGVVHLEEVLMF